MHHFDKLYARIWVSFADKKVTLFRAVIRFRKYPDKNFRWQSVLIKIKNWLSLLIAQKIPPRYDCIHVVLKNQSDYDYSIFREKEVWWRGWPVKSFVFLIFFCNRWNESQYFPSCSSKWIQKSPKARNDITEHFNSCKDTRLERKVTQIAMLTNFKYGPILTCIAEITL